MGSRARHPAARTICWTPATAGRCSIDIEAQGDAAFDALVDEADGVVNSMVFTPLIRSSATTGRRSG